MYINYSAVVRTGLIGSYKLGGTNRFGREPSGMVSSLLVILNVLQFILILGPSLLKSQLSVLLTEKSSRKKKENGSLPRNTVITMKQFIDLAKPKSGGPGPGFLKPD